MDGTKFAKMLSDKHLFELDRMAYKYSAADVREFSEILRQNFAQPLPLVDFAGQALVCLPNLAQISTKSMKQLLSVPAESQPFGVQAMTEEIHATLQIENIHSTRNSIRHILNGNAPRNEEENRIYGMKRGLDFIADQQNEITEKNLHQLYQISTGEYLPAEDKLLPDHFYRHDAVYIVGGEESRKGLSDELLPQVMKQLIDFANAEDDLNELHKAAILHFAFAYYHPYFDGNGRTARLLHLWYLARHGYPAALFTPFSRYIDESKAAYYKAYACGEKCDAHRLYRCDSVPVVFLQRGVQPPAGRHGTGAYRFQGVPTGPCGRQNHRKRTPALGICFVGLRNLGVYDQAVGKGFPQCSLRHNPNLCYEIP